MSGVSWDSEADSEDRSSAERRQSPPSSPPSPSPDRPSSSEDDPEDRVPLARRHVPCRPPAEERQAAIGRAPMRGRQAVANAPSRVEADSPEGVASMVTGQDLANIRARYQIPRDVGLFLPTPDDRVTSSRPGRVAIYKISLRLGLRPPFHPFLISLLDYYSLTPTQLVPNSLRVICAFVILCHHLHITPRIPLFRAFYILRAQKGWWLFQPRHGRVLRLLLPSSVKGWKPQFLFANLDQVKTRWGRPDLRGNANPTIPPGDKDALQQMLTPRSPGMTYC